ncbi:hypothetical protein MALL_0059 [Mycoplasmopsis alligatoris A21JP2]|uniref:Transglutaminase-like domain-containing protein n=2 Tax=Mycoplasmopsis alligatoris TaxID=47687 RepID=D4XWA3_9BACT|nr:hypothetical protein MALL_0059 [Mycoplasmopsis alligatoris A21JP2]
MSSDTQILDDFSKFVLIDWVDGALARIKPQMTQVEMAFELARYVSEMKRYTWYDGRSDFRNRILKQIGVCGDYSQELQILLSIVGIPSVLGNNFGTHQWVKAKIDGKWFNIDPTYYKRNLEVKNNGHRYSIQNNSYWGSFMKTDNQFKGGDSKITNLNGEDPNVLRKVREELWNHPDLGKYVKSDIQDESIIAKLFSADELLKDAAEPYYDSKNDIWYFLGRYKNEENVSLYSAKIMDKEPKKMEEFHNLYKDKISFSELAPVQLLKYKNYLIFQRKYKNHSRTKPLAYNLTTKTFYEFEDMKTWFNEYYGGFYLDEKNGDLYNNDYSQKYDLSKLPNLENEVVKQTAQSYFYELSRIRILNGLTTTQDTFLSINKDKKEKINTFINESLDFYEKNKNQKRFCLRNKSKWNKIKI